MYIKSSIENRIFNVLHNFGFDCSNDDVIKCIDSLVEKYNQYTVDTETFSCHPSKKIISFAGKSGSGKTLSQSIVRDCVSYSITYNFADPLKEICATVFNKYKHESFYGTQTEKETKHNHYGVKISGRDILQFVGTDIVRILNPNFWVDCMRKRIWNTPNDKLIIIGDVRFDNEALLINDFNGIVIKIEASYKPNTVVLHPSEHGIPNYLISDTIINDKVSVKVLSKLLYNILIKYEYIDNKNEKNNINYHI